MKSLQSEVPSPAPLLSSPTLQAERSDLLKRISAEGGFAYVNVAALAAAGDSRAAEAAREMAWEQLHSGPWHSVLPVWRDAYSMACLLVAAFHHGAGEYREALRVLDMGLIMGGMLLRKDLDAAIEKILLSSGDSAEFDEEGVARRWRTRLAEFEDSEEAKMLQILPSKSLSNQMIERKSSLSLERFLSDYFLAGRPVIISDCMFHWPALTKWKDLEYLRRVAGDRTVPVEVGKNYLSANWKQELITFSQFLERIQATECYLSGPTYLAQHPLFDQIQDLRKDIFVPDYCFAGGGELQPLNAWFGPAGTITPLHHDPHHNLFAQVDLDNLDEKEFPRVLNLDFFDCILEEGEMLYIPPKWWHYVRSLSISFSVSFWWTEGSTPS
ncbi:lysine-specific demethylase JMJ30-like isoform X2 [Aristolochia californica]|uniref:lysine-specific demethylase JMJ30-like isoform X2 n=1 Tax=Aristolochia californica TaxID=171875 RepID=UPI0035DDC2B0